MVKVYRKKPIAVEAIQWDGSTESKKAVALLFPNVSVECSNGDLYIRYRGAPRSLIATKGDYLIKEDGEIYSVKEEVFLKFFEEVDLYNEVL